MSTRFSTETDKIYHRNSVKSVLLIHIAGSTLKSHSHGLPTPGKSAKSTSLPLRLNFSTDF